MSACVCVHVWVCRSMLKRKIVCVGVFVFVFVQARVCACVLLVARESVIM